MIGSVLTSETTAIVIPAYNEALRIRDVVLAALRRCPHVIVVDDGSKDATVAVLADLPVHLVRQPRRMGKGAALRAGFSRACALGVQGVMTMDGDGQHDAQDFPRLLAAANRYPQSLIIAARLRNRQAQPWVRRMGNALGDWGVSWACGRQLVDSQSGQRFYPRAVFSLQQAQADGFVYEAQVLIRAARQLHLPIVIVPIAACYPDQQQTVMMRKSHFRLLRDLLKITGYVAGEILRRGHLWREYRRVAAHPLIIAEGP